VVSKLNAKQKLFVEQYLIDPNATHAAKNAGYSDKTAYSQGQRLLKHVEVQKAITEARAKRSEVTKITAELVLTRLGEMMNADPCDIIDQVNGCYKSIFDWPLVWRRMLSAADVQELFSGKGEDKEKIGEIVKYKFIDKMKLFDLIGKHVDVQAFSINMNITDDKNISDRITKSRNRIKHNETEKRVH